MLVCAFLVAFFPDPRPTRRSACRRSITICSICSSSIAPRAGSNCSGCACPRALPYFLGGLRIGGGLALIGAIVAEIAAGSAGQGAGLAFRIVESGYRLNIPRMFAALLLISLTGIVIYPAADARSPSAAAPLARQRAAAARRELARCFVDCARAALRARSAPGSQPLTSPMRSARRSRRLRARSIS